MRRGVRLLFPALWLFPCFPVLFHRHLLSDLPVVDTAMPTTGDRFRAGCLEGVSRQVPRRPTHRTAARQAGWASHLLVPANLSVLWASKCAGTKLLNDRGVWSERESLPPPHRVTHRRGKLPQSHPQKGKGPPRVAHLHTCSPVGGAVLIVCRLSKSWHFSGKSGSLGDRPCGLIAGFHLLSPLSSGSGYNVTSCFFLPPPMSSSRS